METIKKYNDIIKEASRNILKVIIYSIILVIASIAVLMVTLLVMEIFSIKTDNPELTAQIVMMGFSGIGVIVIYVLGFRKNFIEETSMLKALSLEKEEKYGKIISKIYGFLKFFVKSILYFFLIVILATVLGELADKLFGNLGVPANEEILIEEAKRAPLHSFILTVLFAPVVEEFVFRFLLQKMAFTSIVEIIIAFFSKQRNGNDSAVDMEKHNKRVRFWGLIPVLISSIIFAGMHVNYAEGFDQMMYDFLLYSPPSLAFGFAYWKERNITYPIVAHIIVNSIAHFG